MNYYLIDFLWKINHLSLEFVEILQYLKNIDPFSRLKFEKGALSRLVITINVLLLNGGWTVRSNKQPAP